MRRLIALFIALLLVVTACGDGSQPKQRQQPTSAAPTQPATSTPPVVKSDRLLGIYAGGEPGSQYASEALKWAKGAGFQLVINYSFLNATPEDQQRYLNEADSLGLKVAISIKDLLGDRDLDEDKNNHFYHERFGANTTQQAAKIIKFYGKHPAVWGFYISDEKPANPEVKDLDKWIDALAERRAQVERLSGKPTLTVLYWSGPVTDFYRKVKAHTSDLGIDFYPYPESSQIGPISTITSISKMLRAVAKENSWFVAQGFGWRNGNHNETAAQLGVPESATPPSTAAMVSMVRRAVEGGAQNVLFFSYDDNAAGGYMPNSPGDPRQLEAIRLAAQQILSAPWWQS